jgi:hypothetical protein
MVLFLENREFFSRNFANGAKMQDAQYQKDVKYLFGFRGDKNGTRT